MKTFTNMAAQGDFIIFRVDIIPENLEKIQPEQGYLTIAHSETGHDHVMLAERTTAYKDRMTSDDKLFELFLSVEAQPRSSTSGLMTLMKPCLFLLVTM